MSKLYHVHHPDQAQAKWTVKNRIKRGTLIKPCTCERCEKDFELILIEAHHWSYLKQHHADVIWLCRWCHKTVHKELGSDWVDLPVRPDLRLNVQGVK